MASALDLPAASGVIVGSGAAGQYVNLVGFNLRGAAAAVVANIREGGTSSGQIVLYLGVGIAGVSHEVFPRVIGCKAPLYCEYTSGAAAGLGNVLIG